MKILVTLLTVLLFLNISITKAEEEKHINIMIFDVTKSMLGYPDYREEDDIFDEVKDFAYRIIQRYSYDTYLMIIPFGRGVQEDNIFEIHIRSDRDKDQAIEFIKNLEADEMFTWLTYSLNYGINKLRTLEAKLTDFHERAQEILLLTDGEGNGPGDRDGDGNFTIDNLIREHRIGRSDYPHLYTRFVAIGDIFRQSDRERIEQEPGMSMQQIPDEPTIYNVTVRPSQILVYDTHPSFNLLFEIEDDEALGIPVDVKIQSLKAEEIGSGFTISPTSVALTESQVFDVNVLNKDTLERWMRINDFDRVEGVIQLHSDSVYFQPRAIINFEYVFEPVNVTVSYDDLSVRNEGNIRLIFENPTDRVIEAEVVMKKITENIDNLKYVVNPETIIIRGRETINFSIESADPENLKVYRRDINESVEGGITLSFQAISPNVRFEQERIDIAVIVSPDRRALMQRIIGIVIVVAILISLIYIYLSMISKEFSSYVISGMGLNNMPLNDFKKFYTTKIVIGKDIYKDTINSKVLTIKGGLSTILNKRLRLEWHNTDKIEPKSAVEMSTLQPVQLIFDNKNRFEIKVNMNN